MIALRIHFGTRSESMKKQHRLQLDSMKSIRFSIFFIPFLDMEVKSLENVRCWLIWFCIYVVCWFFSLNVHVILRFPYVLVTWVWLISNEPIDTRFHLNNNNLLIWPIHIFRICDAFIGLKSILRSCRLLSQRENYVEGFNGPIKIRNLDRQTIWQFIIYTLETLWNSESCDGL